MNSLQVRKKIITYIKDISFMSADGIIKKNKKEIKSLSETLSSKMSKISEVDEYLDYIVDYIDNLNRFFKKEKRKGKVPYSSMLMFANKDERFSEFLFNREMEIKKKIEDPGLAGVNSTEESNNLKDFSISFKGNDYDFIHTEKGNFFFFSIVDRKVVIQLSNGKIVSFKGYKKICKEKEISGIKLKALYSKVKKVADKNDAMKSFEIYFKRMRTKIDRRKR